MLQNGILRTAVLACPLLFLSIGACGVDSGLDEGTDALPTQPSVSPAAAPPLAADAGELAALGPWGGHSNGYIPLAALTRVIAPGIRLSVFPNSLPGLYLKSDAAAALLSMIKEYNRQTGGFLHPNEGYRTYAGQVYWKLYWTNMGQPGNAATPGYSNHGWGQAVDFDSDSAYDGWLGTNASRFGYSRSTSERWHFDFIGTPGGSSSCGSLSTTTTESDGIPGPNYWKLFQCFAAKRGDYAGPIDGAPGFYTYSGFQRAARDLFGYPDLIDGNFSETGYSRGGLALQYVAAKNDYDVYTGPIDGIPGLNTYKKSAAYFNHLWLTNGLD